MYRIISGSRSELIIRNQITAFYYPDKCYINKMLQDLNPYVYQITGETFKRWTKCRMKMGSKIYVNVAEIGNIPISWFHVICLSVCCMSI